MTRPEIVYAARWWADKLRNPVTHDNGEIFQSSLATALARDLPPASEDQCRNFEAALIVRLENDEYFQDDNWRPNEPDWCAWFRCVGIDYNPVPHLAAALAASGINELLLPIKTMTWVNPGEVKIRAGYSAPIETIPIAQV